MSAVGSQNGVATAPRSLPTLTPEMTETLATFSAYVRFESVDPTENRRRYYDLTWQPTLFGEGALVRSWGRQGRPPTTRASFYPDRADAATEIRRVVRRRLAHGYALTDLIRRRLQAGYRIADWQ